MFDPLLSLKVDVEMLKTAFGNSLEVGPVEEIDPVKGYRLMLGEGSNGKPFLSPWYPHPESGGATRTWSPLVKGQIVGVLNPIGDTRQGVLLRAGFSDQYTPPSDKLDENRVEFGPMTVSASDGGETLTISVGDSSIIITGGDIKLKAGEIFLN